MKQSYFSDEDFESKDFTQLPLEKKVSMKTAHSETVILSMETYLASALRTVSLSSVTSAWQN